MSRFYTLVQLSEHMSETPEGFLLCTDVAITRTGDMLYSAEETGIDATGGIVTVSRTMEDIANPETIASFEGKPITLGHPDDFVDPDTWRKLAVGVVQRVRAGDDVLLADLLITDREAIDAVKSGKLREVSCGYDATFKQSGDAEARASGIIGNHVALVTAGRAGSKCAIIDNKPKGKFMNLKEMMLSSFKKTIDEAMPDEPEEVKQDAEPDTLAAVLEKLTSIESLLTKLTAMEEAEPEVTDTATAEEQTDAAKCTDAETISRAEILSPGIEKTADVMIQSLKAAQKTADGKRVIDSLLAGRELEKSDIPTVFIAASEMLKDQRRKQLDSINTIASVRDSLNNGIVDASKINEINALHYKGGK